MKINLFQKICLGFFVLLVGFWAFLFVSGSKSGFNNYLYSFLFGLIPLLGGAGAMLNARNWGWSAIGKAVFFIGLGLLLWGFGETIWSYYNFFLHVAAPYPSLADIGFAPSIFFYGLGAFFLSKATGAKYGLQSGLAKTFAIGAPIILLGICYYVLINVARGGVLVTPGDPILKTVLDVAYPLGDFVGLTIAVIVSGLSFKFLGGRYLPAIFSILAGLAVMFIADFMFSYTTTVGTYYNGNFGDLLLTFGLFLLTYGALGFDYKPDN